MKTSQFTKHEPPVPVLLKKPCNATDSISLVTTTKQSHGKRNGGKQAADDTKTTSLNILLH